MTIVNDVIFIVGLPGSGKTHLANTFKDRGRVLIDDPKSAPTIENGVKYVIADPHLCHSRVFRQVSQLYRYAFYYLFENDLEQCWENVQGRDDRDIPYKYLVNLSKGYEPYEFITLVQDYQILNVHRARPL